MTGVLPPDRRRALLETAAAEFAEVGYERASLNRIIRARKMSKSSFYHYFDSKESLFNAIVTDLGEALVQALQPPSPAELTGGDFWPRIGELAERLAELDRQSPAFTHFAKLFYLPDAPASAVSASRAAIENWIDQALTAGRATGHVATDLPVPLQRHLVKAVLWAMDEWSITQADSLTPKELRHLAKAQLTAIRRLLSS